MAEIHILHENDAWTAPPEGIFYNRMSASSHTRGHRYAAEYSAVLIA